MTELSQATSPGMTAPQQKLVGRLQHELVAPCCYSQVVADHMSEEAAEMRQEIEQAVLSGAPRVRFWTPTKHVMGRSSSS